MQFSDFPLAKPILSAIVKRGYTTPTPIQQQAIGPILEKKDVMGIAQTGTGKTAAFAIPTLHRMTTMPRSRSIKTLVVTPTRELAVQIGESFQAYGQGTGLRHTVIFGGVKQFHQVRTLRGGVDTVVATPGRLLDLMQQGYIKLHELQILILDEADRMLDMGFINDIKKIIRAVPKERQTLLFSATMPSSITQLAHTMLHDPVRVEVAPASSTADTVQQHLYLVDKGNKKALLTHVLNDPAIPSALVFTRTKRGADNLVKHIKKTGMAAEAIHGNKSQTARQRALQNFKARRTQVLVATDIAARGIDIKELTHVINFEIPNEPETYVHRIGRTGRAASNGTALSFCDHEEKQHVRSIHKLIKKEIPLLEDHPFPMVLNAANVSTGGTPKSNSRTRGRRHSQRGPRRHF